VIPPDGGASRFVGLVSDPHSLTWSPDGRWLALVSGNDQFAAGAAQFREQGAEHHRAHSARGGAIRASHGQCRAEREPAWTPDGRKILFVSDREGARDVYWVHLATSGMPQGKPSRINDGTERHSITLSADTRRPARRFVQLEERIPATPTASDHEFLGRASSVTT